MGLFTEDELDSMKELASSPSGSQAIGDREREQLEDAYWDNPEELNETQSDAIVSAAKGFKSGKGPGISEDFEEDIPSLVHKSRSANARAVDKAKQAPVADSWEEYVENPDRLDFPSVDTKL